MASNLLKFHIHSFKNTNLSTSFVQHKNLTFFPSNNHRNRPKVSSVSILLSSLSSSTIAPPSSKEEAILQAKTCLSKTLQKPLNNPKLAGKLKKLKQPRFQVEIPVIDDSPNSLSQLALDVFRDLPIKRKGSIVKILILWPNPTLKNIATEIFQSNSSNNVENVEISSVINGDSRLLGSIEIAVFLAPETSQLAAIETITDNLYPKPVVILNPKWGFEEENDLGELSGFVESFDVIYSFLGLEVRGILSKRKGVVFKCVRDGVVSGERWIVLVEEENGEMKVVSRFKTRPSIGEVENVLYNLMAINSPITKSAKFLKDLVSNVTGKK
ncbi:hypothetical protein JCGZ_00801 [Jatropha curcas]|uniref:DUF1995 domain-containing protein n=1 Tax=Jatropha curcas TaxID=180498 RepID=A0A067L4M7_JATCU|nr:uncharacterized protein LOC105632875 [Jatropha curcas]KDP39044.1 hypothetical protein JCGZ_00801 [Jatropha curcas]